MACKSLPFTPGGAPATVPTTPKDRGPYFLCKRCVDLVLGAALLLLLSPLMALIALAIKLDTAGPVIFAQDRVGARRRAVRGRTRWEIRTFRFYKFRTMVADADPSLHAGHIRAFVRDRLNAAEGSDARFKLANDPRVTRVGRVLRRASLDELPQLFNVLKGDMSMVGPRPVPVYEASEYRGADLERLAATPGLTGLWQVSGRADVSFAEMMKLDRQYVRTPSLWRDFRILMATIPAVLSGRGAR